MKLRRTRRTKTSFPERLSAEDEGVSDLPLEVCRALKTGRCQDQQARGRERQTIKWLIYTDEIQLAKSVNNCSDQFNHQTMSNCYTWIDNHVDLWLAEQRYTHVGIQG